MWIKVPRSAGSRLRDYAKQRALPASEGPCHPNVGSRARCVPGSRGCGVRASRPEPA
ncbi:hypothetical protein SSAG_01751 [Streptomyces sp. Mg1]|nr:hypothetical protein SSAG_01751 [Streptomyces sp. Mg1]